MGGKKVKIVVFCGIALLVLIGTFAPVLNNVQIVAPMVSDLVVVTRNGQAVPVQQIQSVKYKFSVGPVQPSHEVHREDLRDASDLGDVYHIGAPFSIYHYHSYFFNRVDEIKPEYHSLFLRIAFVDGQVISLSHSIIPGTRGGVIYVDVGDKRNE